MLSARRTTKVVPASAARLSIYLSIDPSIHLSIYLYPSLRTWPSSTHSPTKLDGNSSPGLLATDEAPVRRLSTTTTAVSSHRSGGPPVPLKLRCAGTVDSDGRR